MIIVLLFGIYAILTKVTHSQKDTKYNDVRKSLDLQTEIGIHHGRFKKILHAFKLVFTKNGIEISSSNVDNCSERISSHSS